MTDMWDEYTTVFDYLTVITAEEKTVRVRYDSKRSGNETEVVGPVEYAHHNSGLIRYVQFEPTDRENPYRAYCIDHQDDGDYDGDREFRVDVMDNSKGDNVIGELRGIELVGGDA